MELRRIVGGFSGALLADFFAALFQLILLRSTFYGIPPNIFHGITPHCLTDLRRTDFNGFLLHYFFADFSNATLAEFRQSALTNFLTAHLLTELSIFFVVVAVVRNYNIIYGFLISST